MQNTALFKNIKDEFHTKYFNTAPKRFFFYSVFVALILYLYVCFFPFVMEYYVGRPSESLLPYAISRFTVNVSYSVFEMLLLLLMVLLFWACTSRLAFSLGIVSALGFLLSYASHIKYTNRMELMHCTDLKLTEAAGMAANYLTFSFDIYFISTFLYIVVILFLGTLPGKLISDDLRRFKTSDDSGFIGKLFSKKIRLLVHALVALIVITGILGYTHLFMRSEYSQNPMARYLYFSSNSTSHVLYQFLQSTQSHNSPEEIEKKYRALTDALIREDRELYAEQTAVTEFPDKPTIIVIMNESWWNLDSAPTNQITYSKDPMQPLRALQGRCDLGSVGVNIYGGGTINSESEFLTGLNSKYFSSTSDVEYADTKQKFPSIAKYFNKLGYDTTVIHPYYGDFYSRETRYPVCGFQNIIFEDDMLYRETFAKYISDDSMVNQIIHEYENGSENPDFIFAVSIASHMQTLEYHYEVPQDFTYPISMTFKNGLELSEKDYNSLAHHVNGIYESNLAYTKLIDYFEEQNEPVMVVMFGDHCPSFSVGVLRALGFDATAEPIQQPTVANAQSSKQLYTTPVAAWNNFSEEPFMLDGENITALCDKIIDYTGLPQTRMTLINKYLRTFLKTDTRTFMTDTEGNLITELSTEQTESIETLLMIEDDIFNGERICYDIWDPLVTN